MTQPCKPNAAKKKTQVKPDYLGQVQVKPDYLGQVGGDEDKNALCGRGG